MGGTQSLECQPPHTVLKADGLCYEPKKPNAKGVPRVLVNKQAPASSTPPSAPAPASAASTDSVPAAVGSSGSGVPAGMYCPACPVCPTK